MQILIAEDDVTSRKMLSAVLTKNGYDVLEVENGRDALDILLKPEAPRIAVLDWMMPQLDGISVVQNVRSLPDEKRPYIIMLTTKNAQDDIITGLESGADDYICKPFILGELKARVHVGRRIIELQDRLAHQVDKLNKALRENKILQGIIPICMYCKKIRDDQGFWAQVESYVSKHSPAEFSHSICPSCMHKHYPDLDE